jgi:hypothetical protein
MFSIKAASEQPPVRMYATRRQTSIKYCESSSSENEDGSQNDSFHTSVETDDDYSDSELQTNTKNKRKLTNSTKTRQISAASSSNANENIDWKYLVCEGLFDNLAARFGQDQLIEAKDWVVV